MMRRLVDDQTVVPHDESTLVRSGEVILSEPERQAGDRLRGCVSRCSGVP
jgi:hypothetical protein